MTESTPVHVWLPGRTEPVLAGIFTRESAPLRGKFKYDEAYLQARHPGLAPDLPVRRQEHAIIGGKAIFPLLLDAGPDAWGRHMLARRLGHAVSEFDALSLCHADGVGNLALGELTEERQHLLTLEEFLQILRELEAGSPAQDSMEERVMDAAHNGTSLGGTKPKLTLVRDGVQYLAKFPEPGDSRWLPHIEWSMLQLARECGIRTCEAEVWTPPGSIRSALLVRRFDREALPGGWARTGFVSAHALLRLDMFPSTQDDQLQFGPLGFSQATMRKSYVALASDMARWCGGKDVHLQERRELWRRVVFNALIRNLDDHPRNHGLLCESNDPHVWRLSPAFDLVPARVLSQHPALAMAYRYLPATKRGRVQSAARLVSQIDIEMLLASAVEHYGYDLEEAEVFLHAAASTVHARWQELMGEAGMPEAEIRLYAPIFTFAAQVSLSRPVAG
jgi:serine/threonine-protein kinase HipA